MPTHALLRAGCTRYALSLAVRDRSVIRVRQGWYALPQLSAAETRAARVGGRLACSSAASHHGLAVRGDRLHVEVLRNSARLRDPSDHRRRLNGNATIHWTSTQADGRRPCVTVLEALTHMATCASPEQTIAAVDSALRLELISESDWNGVVALVPRRLRRLLVEVHRESESITESVVRFRLSMLGIRTRAQVSIAGVGRVDLLIGTALVIELDGKRYHTDPQRFENDRRRDARLSARGYRVLRFSYTQVFERWHEVRAAIVSAIARGDASL